MRHSVVGILGWLHAACLLVLGCSVEVPTEPLPERSPASEARPVPEIAPSDVRQPGPGAPVADGRAPAPGRSVVESALSVQQLFDIGEPQPLEAGLDLEALATEGTPAALVSPRNAVDVIRERARYRHESGTLGPEGAHDQRVGVAEAGVALPVDDDESIYIRSGVRVDYETDDGILVGDPEPTPTLGIEVRF